MAARYGDWSPLSGLLFLWLSSERFTGAAGCSLAGYREAGVREIPPDSGAIQRGLSILKDGQHRRKRHPLAEEHLPHRLVVGVEFSDPGRGRD